MWAMPAPMSLDLRQRIVRRGRAWQLDPRSRATFCRQPVGGDQADAAGADDRQCRRRRALAAIVARCSSRMRPTSRGWSRRRPDITLAELQAELQRRVGIVAGLSTIHNALRRIGLRHKKSP